MLGRGRRAWVGFALLTARASGCGDESSDGPPVQPDAAVPGAGAPADDPSLARGNSLAISPSHYCARRQAGLFCWGENFLGQLGTGDEQSSDVPVQATVAGADIVEIAAATGRTCVRRGSGEIACWGANDKA
jgi:hypothetical protein